MNSQSPGETPADDKKPDSPVTIDQFHIGSHRNFVYLVTSRGQSIVIDPQSDLGPWEKRIAELGSTLKGVVLTHTHWDHVAGVPLIAERYASENIPIHVHRADAKRLEQSPENVRRQLTFVEDGETIAVGAHRLKVMHTPGHSAGECCYFLEGTPSSLFTGDTVFVGDVGRCDLETGSVSEMFATLQRLKSLPGETVIFPGHHYGFTATSTIDEERATSPAWACKTVEELDALP